ncbi:MAG TPA: F0F1 ATP synthase subunit A, partial [Candidatus Kapabacteria bacterium]|nr:F0F1 ATP synthase subunit A [Candidatus Kapabacteria bacterium]
SGIQNLLEVLIVFIRDEVVAPNLPARPAKRLLPYFLSLFFFILILNIFGLMPGGHAATSALGTTIALALTAFLVVNYTAIKESGIGAWFHHLLGGAPAFLAPIMVPIEIMGIFTKPFALAIRLFANMTAGHVALLALVGIIFYFKQLFGASVGYSVTVPSVLFSVFVLCLELLVAFLQAYVFTMLTAVFTGLAVGDHSHDEEHHH